MKAIGLSKGWYSVYVRGMESPVRMSEVGGEKLASYLEKEPSAFVHIKATSGKEYTIRTTTIDRVEKFEPSRTGYKTVTELNMPNLASATDRNWR